ncbi:hypothetical protein A4X09_0g235 [Tilletia walkeri]|uniref:Uncharacterized protein n=1 Tax=Tilletia walkeri TaxID=117179 RepID=A0A8X7T7R6_9BASI|nr:hypothetical protein A4X09_0g235 [Tilletia walkeri]
MNLRRCIEDSIQRFEPVTVKASARISQTFLEAQVADAAEDELAPSGTLLEVNATGHVTAMLSPLSHVSTRSRLRRPSSSTSTRSAFFGGRRRSSISSVPGSDHTANESDIDDINLGSKGTAPMALQPVEIPNSLNEKPSPLIMSSSTNVDVASSFADADEDEDHGLDTTHPAHFQSPVGTLFSLGNHSRHKLLPQNAEVNLLSCCDRKDATPNTIKRSSASTRARCQTRSPSGFQEPRIQ